MPQGWGKLDFSLENSFRVSLQFYRGFCRFFVDIIKCIQHLSETVIFTVFVSLITSYCKFEIKCSIMPHFPLTHESQCFSIKDVDQLLQFNSLSEGGDPHEI